ncbi:MAG: class I SAM-dependent methyltransferase [Crocinitomicaceae bacterium]
MDNKLESVNCNICRNDNFELISNKGQHNIPLSVGLCKECGLGYLNPRWNADGYIEFYKNEYDKYYRPELISNKSAVGFKINPILQRLKDRDIVPNKLKTVLDIGSGAGDNLLDVRKQFTDSKLFAIEPSLESQEVLKNNNINILSDDVNANWDSKSTTKFDLIIMRHVLEHFLDPLAILKRVKNVLDEKGVLYIAVPNNLAPNQSLEKSWFRVVHTYYFNKYSLKNILDLAGLDCIEIVEGDKFNAGEVFLMAKKGNLEKEIKIDKEHYITQKAVFESVKKKQNSPVYKLTQTLKKMIKRIWS